MLLKEHWKNCETYEKCYVVTLMRIIPLPFSHYTSLFRYTSLWEEYYSMHEERLRWNLVEKLNRKKRYINNPRYI